MEEDVAQKAYPVLQATSCIHGRGGGEAAQARHLLRLRHRRRSLPDDRFDDALVDVEPAALLGRRQRVGNVSHDAVTHDVVPD